MRIIIELDGTPVETISVRAAEAPLMSQQPPPELLDHTFRAVFERETRPEVRRKALQLADFFHLPARSAEPTASSFA